jgi:hypothetical protein
MGSQTEDKRRTGAKVGQPGEQNRTSQENAGSTEGGGTRNAGNTVERASSDGGAGRESRSDDRDLVAKDDGITRADIEAGNDSSSQTGQIGSKDRERSGSTRSRNS